MAEDWSLEQDIERARDGIDSFAGDGATEMEAFERVAAVARTALEALKKIADPEVLDANWRAMRETARAAVAKARGTDGG